MDSQINDQYRSAWGARRFFEQHRAVSRLRQLLRPGSLIAWDPLRKQVAGTVLTSFVSPRAGHVTQLCIAPDRQGAALAMNSCAVRSARWRRAAPNWSALRSPRAIGRRFSSTCAAASSNAGGFWPVPGIEEAAEMRLAPSSPRPWDSRDRYRCRRRGRPGHRKALSRCPNQNPEERPQRASLHLCAEYFADAVSAAYTGQTALLSRTDCGPPASAFPRASFCVTAFVLRLPCSREKKCSPGPAPGALKPTASKHWFTGRHRHRRIRRFHGQCIWRRRPNGDLHGPVE